MSRTSTNEEAAVDHVDTKCITDAVAMAIRKTYTHTHTRVVSSLIHRDPPLPPPLCLCVSDHVTSVSCDVDATTRQYLRLPKGMITTGGPLKHKDTHIQTDPPHTRRGKWL